MKLSTLKKQAQQSTARRGHRMQWGDVYGRPPVPHLGLPHSNFSQSATCRDCGMEVTITEHPAPNGINIGGEAVALNCRRAYPVTPIGDPGHKEKQADLVRNLTTRPAWKLSDCTFTP